jgi:hypothetical protein
MLLLGGVTGAVHTCASSLLGGVTGVLHTCASSLLGGVSCVLACFAREGCKEDGVCVHACVRQQQAVNAPAECFLV